MGEEGDDGRMLRKDIRVIRPLQYTSGNGSWNLMCIVLVPSTSWVGQRSHQTVVGGPADLCPCLSETAIPAEVASPAPLPQVVQWRPAGPTAPPGPPTTYTVYMYTCTLALVVWLRFRPVPEFWIQT